MLPVAVRFTLSWPSQRSLLPFGVFVFLTLSSRTPELDERIGDGHLSLPAAAAAGHHPWNGLRGGYQINGGKGLDAFQAMLWKYTAKCALPEGKSLTAPPGPTGKRLKFPGYFGAAPEWNDGPCDRACQEKVSGCLIALTNRTGKHVLVSLIGDNPALGKNFMPNDNDIGFPHQEGVFFGNVFTNEAYACQGSAVTKGPQVKRFCALEPQTCSGLPDFTDVGRCEDVCKIRCLRLSDGSERCVASSCTDPKGTTWQHPITVYLRNKIEAANADAMKGVIATDQGIDGLDQGDTATYRGVDFTRAGGADVATFAVTVSEQRRPGQVEVWLDGKKRIGVLDLQTLPAAASSAASAVTAPPSGPAAPMAAPSDRLAGGVELSAPVLAPGISGPHDVTLKFVGGKKMGRLSLIEFR